MTYEQKLYSMKGIDLIREADKLGVKVITNKPRTALKESKDKVVERILDHEHVNIVMDQKKELGIKVPEIDPKKVEVITETHIKPKRGQLITYNGEAKTICNWGKALGISPNTLYNRLYHLNWPIERAFSK